MTKKLTQRIPYHHQLILILFYPILHIIQLINNQITFTKSWQTKKIITNS